MTPLCPFTGKPFELKSVNRGGWFALIKSHLGSYATSLFEKKSDLIMFLQKRNPQSNAAKGPALKPRMICPFTGQEIKPTRTGNGDYQAMTARGDAGLVYGPFALKSQLVYFVSMRDGVEPNFPRATTIEVREREAPLADPLADEKELAKASGEVVREIVSAE